MPLQNDLVLFSHHSEHTFSNFTASPTRTAILAPCCVTDSPQISGTLLSGIAFTDCTATCKPWDAAMGWIATTTSCSRLESFTTHQGAFFDSLSVCLGTVRLTKHDRSVFEGSQRISHPSKIWDTATEMLEYTTLHSPNIPVQIYIYLPTTFWLKALSLCAHESTKVSDYIAVHLQVMFWCGSGALLH